jgi:hypothetical protein
LPFSAASTPSRSRLKSGNLLGAGKNLHQRRTWRDCRETYWFGQRGIGIPGQQSIQLGGSIAAPPFAFDQIDLETGALALGADRVLLRHQAHAIALNYQMLERANELQGFVENSRLAHRLEITRIGRLDFPFQIEAGRIVAGIRLTGQRFRDLAPQTAFAREGNP